MSELDPSLLRQPEDIKQPTVFDIFNSGGLFNVDGLPLTALNTSDYDTAGGLRLEPYQRGDSPSRDASEFPYNATWFEYLRNNYGDSLRLLEGLRQAYQAELLHPDQELSGQDIITIYHMGVQLPQYLLWRANNPVRNGEIPAASAVLRQALLGVGTVILSIPAEKLITMSGKDVAGLAEKNGDLIGDLPRLDVPQMVCPASPEMIAGLTDALLHGNEKRGTGQLLDALDVDIRALGGLAEFAALYHIHELELAEQITKLYEEPIKKVASFAIQKPKTKVEKFDEIATAYAKVINEEQTRIYELLGRVDRPPRMTLMRLYKVRHEFIAGRVGALEFDDPENATPEVMQELERLITMVEASRKSH